jgi:hypothetical protein
MKTTLLSTLVHASQSMVRSAMSRDTKDATEHSNKKRRYAPTDVTELSFATNALKPSLHPSAPKFIRLHLDILRSLYQRGSATNGNDDNGIASAFKGVEVWSTIERFLFKRDELVQGKQTVVSMANIHSEAMRYVDTVNHSSQLVEAAATAAQPGSSLHSPQWRSASPRPVHNNRAKLTSQPIGAASSPQPMTAKSSSLSVKSGHASFGIVAQLLKRRRDLVANAFQENATRPFETLLTATNAHIVALQRTLYQIQQALRQEQYQEWHDLVVVAPHATARKRLAHQTHAPSPLLGPIPPAVVAATAAASTIKDAPHLLPKPQLRLQAADLECKIRLWSLLAQDLRQAITLEP